MYNKPGIHHTGTVIRYLARYSHKIAISDQRIVGLIDDQVRFRYRDYRDDQSKILAQPAKREEPPKTEEARPYPCPHCHRGHLIPIHELAPVGPTAPLAPG